MRPSLLFTVLVAGLPTLAGAAAQIRVHSLEKAAILHEGRLKPMDTYARHMLLQFSGRSRLKSLSALETMARILFTPASIENEPLFLINNPEVADALGIAAEKRRRYAFAQLRPSLAKLERLAREAADIPEDRQDLVGKEILRVRGNLIEYQALAGTFAYILPDSIFRVELPENRSALRLPAGQSRFSFWDLMGNASILVDALREDREDTAGRSPARTELVSLARIMFLKVQSLRPSSFRALPFAARPGVLEWLSPTEAVASARTLRAFRPDLDTWAQAALAYRAGDQEGFDKAVGAFNDRVGNLAYDQVQAAHFPLEVLYQKTDPYYRALTLYWLALLACFAFFLARGRWLYRSSLWICLAGLVFHLGGMVARIVIMKRPPVASLYESFPFVAAASILAALVLERVNRGKHRSEGIGLLSASLMGVILLSIANRYAAEGDTLNMLVAVLNSNFWLSTHVICVTIGYSACLLSGALGHIWLFRALLPGEASRPERLKPIGSMVYGTLCFGLLFAFIGTVLGGIWADQSWGRFWGWDPKENGALLIVVWCALLLHARQWGYVHGPGMALGTVFCAIVVSLAWFGVNLLNVGLHSYGFTSGGAFKLFGYIGAELLFMGGACLGLKLRSGMRAGSRSAAPPTRRSISVLLPDAKNS
jgi:ABC-type transport system involved in cytochrome c biogenesis permease subunit